MIAKVVGDYQPKTVEEIALKKEEYATVFNQSDGWCYGESESCFGRFPANCITILQQKEASKAHNQRKINQGFFVFYFNFNFNFFLLYFICFCFLFYFFLIFIFYFLFKFFYFFFQKNFQN